MRRIIAICTLIFFIIALAGCATTTTGEKTAAGAGLGALGGALIGYLSTGKTSGALAGAAIGAAVGGLAGYIIGKHEEKQYKTAQQVYKENPAFAKKDSKLEPTVVKLDPYVKNMDGKKVTAIKVEQPVKLCMDYDIAIGMGNDQKAIDKKDVVLDNYLVMSDGTETPHATRNPDRDVSVGGDKACVSIKKGLPKGLPEGNYTHVAVVKVGDKERKKKEKVLVVRSGDEIKIYVLNMN